MATRYANLTGIKFLEEPRGANKGGVVVIDFDLGAVAYTGGTDTVQVGGGGSDAGIATTLTLAQLIASHRRDGRTVTIGGATPFLAGRQAAATNGPDIFNQLPSTYLTASAGNVQTNLFSAFTGGSAVTTVATRFDAPCGIVVAYQASYPNNIPE